jgi:hypothetical protein
MLTQPNLVVYEYQGIRRALRPISVMVTRTTHRITLDNGAICVVPAPRRFGCTMKLIFEG